MHDVLLYHTSVGWATDLLSVEKFAELLIVREDYSSVSSIYHL